MPWRGTLSPPSPLLLQWCFNSTDTASTLRALARLGGAAAHDPDCVLPILRSAKLVAGSFTFPESSYAAFGAGVLASTARDPGATKSILDAVERSALSMSTAAACDALYGVAALGAKASAPFLSKLLASATKPSGLADAPQKRHVVQVLWATAMLGVSESALERAAAAARYSGFLSASEASDCLWAAATLRLGGRKEWMPFMKDAAREAPNFSGSQAAAAFWGAAALFGSSGSSGAAQCQPLLAAASHTAPSFNPMEAAQSLWAAAALGLPFSTPQVGQLHLAAARCASAMSKEGLSLCLWASCTLCAPIEAFFTAAVQHADQYSSQLAVMVLYAAAMPGGGAAAALAAAGGGDWVSVAAAAAAQGLHPSSAAPCLWAAALLGVREEGLVCALLAAASHASAGFDAAAAGQALWAASIMLPSGLVPAAACAAVRALVAAAMRQSAAKGSAVAAVHCLYGAAKLGAACDHSTARSLLAAVARHAAALSPSEVSQALFSAALLPKVTRESLRPLAAAASRLASQLSGSEAAACLWALASFAPPDLLDAEQLRPFLAAVEQAAATLSPEDAGAVLQVHYSGLRVGPACLMACLSLSPCPPLPTPARHWEDLKATLIDLGLPMKFDVVIMDGRWVVDVVVDMPGGGRVAVVAARDDEYYDTNKDVWEWVAKPQHLRRKQFAAVGISEAVVTAWEWEGSNGKSEKEALLKAKLAAAEM